MCDAMGINPKDKNLIAQATERTMPKSSKRTNGGNGRRKGKLGDRLKIERPRDRLKVIDPVEWGICHRKMEILIANGMGDLAVRVLKVFISRKGDSEVRFDSPVWALSMLPYRVLQALEDNGFATVGAVAAATDDELMEINLISTITVGWIRQALEEVALPKRK
jgi:hypothetical protein